MAGGKGQGQFSVNLSLTQQVGQQLHPIRAKQHVGLAIHVGHSDRQPKGLEKAVTVHGGGLLLGYEPELV